MENLKKCIESNKMLLKTLFIVIMIIVIGVGIVGIFVHYHSWDKFFKLDIWNNFWSVVGSILGVMGAYFISRSQIKKERTYQNLDSLLESIDKITGYKDFHTSKIKNDYTKSLFNEIVYLLLDETNDYQNIENMLKRIYSEQYLAKQGTDFKTFTANLKKLRILIMMFQQAPQSQTLSDINKTRFA